MSSDVIDLEGDIAWALAQKNRLTKAEVADMQRQLHDLEQKLIGLAENVLHWRGVWDFCQTLENMPNISASVRAEAAEGLAKAERVYQIADHDRAVLSSRLRWDARYKARYPIN